MKKVILVAVAGLLVGAGVAHFIGVKQINKACAKGFQTGVTVGAQLVFPVQVTFQPEDTVKIENEVCPKILKGEQ